MRRLEEDVERALATSAFDPSSLSVDVQTGAQHTVQEKTVQIFFAAHADVARLFKAVLATVQRRIERLNGRTASESEAFDAMLEHCFEPWEVPNVVVPRDHRVFERDGWRCSTTSWVCAANVRW